MYNTKFNMIDGLEVYPGYLDQEGRKKILETYRDMRGFMWCGCRSDVKLYYKISRDLRIYPEHNNYQHDINCSRYCSETGVKERKTGYVVDDENGEVTAYLNFNPKNISFKDDEESVGKEDNCDKKEEDTNSEEQVLEKETVTKIEEKSEPKLSLEALIRSINVDTYTEKVFKNQNIDQRVNFTKQVYHRMKKVRVSRMRKSIGELSLESDGVRFIYIPFSGIVKNEANGLKKCYFSTSGGDEKVYNNFIFPETAEKAINKFKKLYGIEPNEDTMLAGFQYYKKTRSGIKYRVLGRVHLFQISNVGIYCRSLFEKEIYDILSQIVLERINIKFWIPADDESIGAIIDVAGKSKKILLLFRNKSDERVVFDENMYEPLVVGASDPLTKERFNEVLQKMSLLK